MRVCERGKYALVYSFEVNICAYISLVNMRTRERAIEGMCGVGCSGGRVHSQCEVLVQNVRNWSEQCRPAMPRNQAIALH